MKEDFSKLIKTLLGCKTIQHLESTYKMFENFEQKYIYNYMHSFNLKVKNTLRNDIWYYRGFFQGLHAQKLNQLSNLKP